MKPNSAPLATTFWRNPADLTSTARQCRHNLPHFVGFRHRAIVGVPVSTPTKEPDSLLQCPLPSNRLEWYTKMPLFEMKGIILLIWFPRTEKAGRRLVWHIFPDVCYSMHRVLADEADIKALSSQGFIHKVWFIILFMESQNESMGQP